MTTNDFWGETIKENRSKQNRLVSISSMIRKMPRSEITASAILKKMLAGYQ
jgi:hypothetical protein